MMESSGEEKISFEDQVEAFLLVMFGLAFLAGALAVTIQTILTGDLRIFAGFGITVAISFVASAFLVEGLPAK